MAPLSWHASIWLAVHPLAFGKRCVVEEDCAARDRSDLAEGNNRLAAAVSRLTSAVDDSAAPVKTCSVIFYLSLRYYVRSRFSWLRTSSRSSSAKNLPVPHTNFVEERMICRGRSKATDWRRRLPPGKRRARVWRARAPRFVLRAR